MDNLFADCHQNASFAYVDIGEEVLCSMADADEFFCFVPLEDSDALGFRVKKDICIHLDPTEGIFDEVPISVDFEDESVCAVGKIEFVRGVNYLNTRHSIS